MRWHESQEWQRYLELLAERPESFRNQGLIDIILDEDTIDQYYEEKQIRLGVVYESPYSMMIVDLVNERNADGSEGRIHTYERQLPTVSKGAVIAVPFYNGGIVIIKQFRHALRNSIWSFPRGFGEKGISSRDNLYKELQEEIGIHEISDIAYLGKVTADSGASGTFADVYSCSVDTPICKYGYEGIEDLKIVSEQEMKHLIHSGNIVDGFTLAAYALYQAVTKNDDVI